MPFKAHAACRRHIPKQRHRVTNWAEYDAALRQRGSLTVWFTDAAVAAWRAEPRTTPGGQPHYSALAILTVLTLRAVFRLALRQTEGLIGSILRLLGLDLAIPDHSTLTSRAQLVRMRVDLANQLRGVLKPFGLIAGRGGGQAFADRVRALVANGPLQAVAEALLAAWQAITSQVAILTRRLIVMARQDQAVKRLMTTPGVGTLVALTYVSVIDQPWHLPSPPASAPILA